MTNSSEKFKNGTMEDDPTMFMVSSFDILFFRLSSAVEAIVFVVTIFNVLPIIYRARNRLYNYIKCHHWPEKLAIFPRSSFYERFSIVFLLMLLIITIRFYDFLEASLFRSMTRQQKLRFLLYILSTVGQ